MGSLSSTAGVVSPRLLFEKLDTVDSSRRSETLEGAAASSLLINTILSFLFDSSSSSWTALVPPVVIDSITAESVSDKPLACVRFAVADESVVLSVTSSVEDWSKQKIQK